eukprot:3845960-Rhodomonas_salina.1
MKDLDPAATAKHKASLKDNGEEICWARLAVSCSTVAGFKFWYFVLFSAVSELGMTDLNDSLRASRTPHQRRHLLGRRAAGIRPDLKKSGRTSNSIQISRLDSMHCRGFWARQGVSDLGLE